MALASPEPAETGIWPDAWLLKAVESGLIDAPPVRRGTAAAGEPRPDPGRGRVPHPLYVPARLARRSSGVRSFVIDSRPAKDGAVLERNGRTSSRSRSGCRCRRCTQGEPEELDRSLDVFTA